MTRLLVVSKNQISSAVAAALAAQDIVTGSQLSSHTSLTTAAHGGIVASTDSRLTDARTPTDGSVTNAKVATGAAIDEAKLNLASDAAVGTASRRTLGTGAQQAAAGNDSRFSNQRTPTDGSVTDAKVSSSAAIQESKLALASDAAAGTASRRTLGTGSQQAAAGNDSRITGAQQTSEKNQANGYAGLGSTGFVAPAQLGSGTRDSTTVLYGDGTYKSAPSGGGSSQTIQDEGTSLTQRSALNFVGAGVTAADDSTNGRTNVTVAGPSAASETASGIAELATTAEVQAGTDTVRIVTPAGLKSLVDLLLPVGTIQMSAAATTPSGWLLCNGAAVSRTTYSALFSAIGTTFGTGDNSTTFNVPDLRGRSPMGSGAGPGLTSRGRGQTLGSESVSLSEANLPPHEHMFSYANNSQTAHGGSFSRVLSIDANYDSGKPASGRSATNGGNGTGAAVDNVSPSTVVAFVIKT